MMSRTTAASLASLVRGRRIARNSQRRVKGEGFPGEEREKKKKVRKGIAVEGQEAGRTRWRRGGSNEEGCSHGDNRL